MIRNVLVIILAVSLAFVVCGCSGDDAADVSSDSAISPITEWQSKNGQSEPHDVPSDGNQNATGNETDTKESSSQEDTGSKGAAADRQKEYADVLSDAFKSVGVKFSYAFHSYSDGARVTAGEGRFKSASVIKLFIMDYAYYCCQNGDITPDTVVSGRKLSDVIESMITISDNASTNTLIEHFGMEKINSYIASQGYADTILARKMLDTAAAAQGKENYTSAADVMKFLDKLYSGKDSGYCKTMLDTMKRQQVSTKIRRRFPGNIVIANKTGELSDTENDVGIIFSDGGDFALVCLTAGGDSVSRDAISDAAYNLYELVNKK